MIIFCGLFTEARKVSEEISRVTSLRDEKSGELGKETHKKEMDVLTSHGSCFRTLFLFTDNVLDMLIL